MLNESIIKILSVTRVELLTGFTVEDINNIAHNEKNLLRGGLFVGVARFELTISWSQTKRDTGLRYTPNFKIYSQN